MYRPNLKSVALPVPEIFKTLGSPWIRPRPPFSKIFNGLLFGWTLWMYRPNLKSVALPVPEIIAGTLKLWAVGSPWIRPRSLFSKILDGFLFGWTLWICRPNLKSVPFCYKGYLKTLGSPCIRPRSLLSKMFNGLLFGWTLWMYRPNLKTIALPVPEIIAGIKNFGQSLDTPFTVIQGHWFWYQSKAHMRLPISPS